MVKIVVGSFYHETNTFNPFQTNTEDFIFVEGEEITKRLASTEVFNKRGVEVIPSIYATGLSSGVVTQEAYRYFADKILTTLETEPEIDGIWLHLHGSMVVENIGSGELALLKEIRGYVGDEVPISLTLDIHANNAINLNEYVNIVCSYRTVPHVDQYETEQITAHLLIDAIEKRSMIKPSFIRLPMVISGEKALGAAEPLKSIFAKLEEVENREGILTASFFICHAWSDSENTASSIIVTPLSESYEGVADEVAKELAEYVYNKRNEFEFDALVLEPEEAIGRALNEKEKPVFISDSGDNSTAGAPGINTLLLRLLNEKELGSKKIAIAAIFDEEAFKLLNVCKVGERISIRVGKDYDKNSAPVFLEGTLKAKGDLLGYSNVSADKVGEVCTVTVGNLDVVIANRGDSFITINHFTSAGININDYDIIVVKQGYLFDELSAVSKLDILAMTPGATYQRIEDLPYQFIPRPIFPLDQGKEDLTSILQL
ncbi:M81 family metallopeptidase [Bacillus sp. FSL K6-3431]|uniref:M81 family metallopeptidase n=1 Tax=Bacillus sp. FSL K6-3431 TaxID=2921500 RepID=UPI0030F875CF